MDFETYIKNLMGINEEIKEKEGAYSTTLSNMIETNKKTYRKLRHCINYLNEDWESIRKLDTNETIDIVMFIMLFIRENKGEIEVPRSLLSSEYSLFIKNFKDIINNMIFHFDKAGTA